MTKEEFENYKNKIHKRSRLEYVYIGFELEKLKNLSLTPNLPIEPLTSFILDYMAYGTESSKENVLRELDNI